MPATPQDIDIAGAEVVEAPVAPPHLVLIDGSGFLFRAFHALPPMSRPDGTPVNAVFGFTNMLAKLLREQVGTHIAVIFDAGRVTFRNRLYDDYKAHRPPPPDELIPQFALVREATDAFCVPAIELDDWEADDLIAAYTRAATDTGWQVTIVSSDKDLMQLIRPGVGMLDPIKAKPIGPAEVMEKFGVAPEKMVEVQALIGDSTDNVPGIPGIGPKRAAELVNEYGDVEAVLAAASGMKPSKRRDSLIEHADKARLSRELVRLREDVPLPAPLDSLAACQIDRARLGGFLNAQGFRSILLRMGLEEAAPAPEAAAPGRALQAELGLVTQPRPAAPAEESGFGGYETLTDAAALARWTEAARLAGWVAIGAHTCAVPSPRPPPARGGGEEQADANETLPLPLREGSGEGSPDPRPRLVGISLAIEPGRACYLPLAHQGLAAQVDAADAIALLGPLLTDPAILKIYHDAKSAMLAMGRAGFPTAAPSDDAMLISYAQEAGLHGHALDELARLHLGHTPVNLDEVTGTGRNRLAFDAVPIDRATAHAAEAADVTFRLWCALRPRLRFARALALYEQVDRRLTHVLLDMERAGVKVDADDLRRMSAEFEVRMAAIERDIHQLAGRAFNLGSAKQLGEVLFDEQGLPGGKRMKTGAWGTDANVLQGLADQGHALPGRILEWRQLQKLKSTYADALVGQIHPGTGRVHTSFAMAATTTGRLSSTDPNLQNIPVRTEEGGRIRRAFIAEPGHILMSADYSQIELRLLAHVADVPALSESFRNGEDIHARTASEVFGIPMAGMDPLTRRRAKAINFGIIYGISAFGLARQLGIGGGEARVYIDAYFARYPGIRDYMERTKEEARIHGYVTTPFGRRCWVPGIAEKSGPKRGYAERQAINAPLQGGAADIIKQAMVRLPRALAEAGLSARLLLQVHDELLFEAPAAEAEALQAIARQVMEKAAELTVPLVVETGVGLTWADAH